MKKELYMFTFHKKASLLILFCLLFPLVIHASGLKKLSEKELVQLSDVIVVGTVDKKEALWVGRHIETTYGIQAKEYWKGDLGDSFEFTQMGGELQRPLPIAMQADGAPKFFEGEQVILFLEKPKMKFKNENTPNLPPESKLTNSCKVVGWTQGKFTIIKDTETNQDKVLRLGMESMRVVDRRELDKRIEAAKAYSGVSAQKQEKPLKSQQSQLNSPLSRKAPMKKAGMNSSPNLKGDEKVLVDKGSISILNLPQREKLDDFKQRIQDYLK